MSSVDPTKPKPFVPLAPSGPPPATKTETKKPSADLEFVPTGPKPSYGVLFGPGVSGAVFENKSPNLASMSDAQLIAKTGAMIGAIRANPGKANDEDLKLVRAMTMEIVARANAKLTPKSEPSKMSNAELGATLMAFDVAKASGMPLSKEQLAWYAKGNAVWKERVSVDPDKALAEIEAERGKVQKEAAAKCWGASAGTVGLFPGMEWASTASTAIAVYDAIKRGSALGVGVELGVAALGHLPGGKIVEIIWTASTAAECKEALEKLEFLENAADVQKAKKAKP